ncbi:MAG: protein kinase [Planctomycetota bacterium]
MTSPDKDRNDLPPVSDALKVAAFEDALRDERRVESTLPMGDSESTRIATLKLLNAAFHRPQSDANELPFHTVGRFELLRRLGSGGFGDVFLANDPILQRHVAIKLPRYDRRSDPALRSRFVREGEAAARVSHPNIIPVYEAGEQKGVLYIVSEFCDGPTLSQWIREQEQPTEVREAAKIVLQLADAVEHLHTRGILHRDIKPANVLFPTSDADLQKNVPRLTDFGLAKDTTDFSAETQSGTILGTFKYISPEQLSGTTKEVNPSSDVYSLGVLLFELLTHHAPHEGESHYELLKSVCENPAPLPSSYVASVPAELDAICFKCLQKSHRERYQSAADLREDLQRYLNGDPVSVPVRRATRLFARKSKRILVAAFFVVALAALSSFVVRTPSDRNASLTLDGQGDHFVASSLSYDGSHAITLEAWVKPRSEVGGIVMCIGGILNLTLHSSDGLIASIAGIQEDDIFHLVSEDSIRVEEWNHVAGVYDGSRLTLFVNGRRQQGKLRHDFGVLTEDSSYRELREDFPEIKLQTIWSGLSFAAGANPWAQPDYRAPYEGGIDEVRVSRCVRYTKDFIPEERFSSDDETLALFHFDHVEENTVEDDSPNQHDGRLFDTIRRPW